MGLPSPDVEDSEIERLVDYAELARQDEWSLRSALVRYAQVAPARASVVLELVRRTDGALKHLASHPDRATDADMPLLEVARTLDEIGDTLAAWAVERGAPPHDRVESLAKDAAEELSRLGVERENWDGRRPPGRSRG